MAKKTQVGKNVTDYLNNTLENAQNSAAAALAAGYPPESVYSQAYYAGVPYLYMYGDEQQAEALKRAGGMYDEYKAAGQYDKTDYGDLEGAYDEAGQYQKTDYGDLESAYGKAGKYNMTDYGDIESAYKGFGNYDAANYGEADYSTKNIQEHMSPYEELVSRRAEARLKKGYDEARGERELSAVRQGAFGGSGAAIQEEVARRNYLEQAEDMNAKNLQAAFESGADLYGREFSDNFSAQQAEEASRQFGKNAQLSGIEGLMAARNQRAAQIAAAKEAEFAGLEGQLNTRNMTAAQIAAAKEALFAGLEGKFNARNMTAAQIAAAKEAEFAGLGGMSDSINQYASLAEQKKNMQLANLAAMQQAGQQKEKDRYEKNLYGLNVAGQQANILGPVSGATAPIQTMKNPSPGIGQQILGAASAAAGIASGLGLGKAEGGLIRGIEMLRRGGLVHRYVNGGLAMLYDPMGLPEDYNLSPDQDLAMNGGGVGSLPYNGQ